MTQFAPIILFPTADFRFIAGVCWQFLAFQSFVTAASLEGKALSGDGALPNEVLIPAN